MSSASPLALAAAVDVALGTTVSTNDDAADGAVVPPYSTEDKGEYLGASVEFKVTCFGSIAFADGA